MNQTHKRKTTVIILLVIAILLIITTAYNVRTNPNMNHFWQSVFGEHMVHGKLTPMETGLNYQIGRYLDYSVCTSGSKLIMIDENGKEAKTFDLLMEHPMISSADTYMVVGDVGGTSVKLFSKGKISKEFETEEAIIFVRVNQKGYFSVVTEEKGYKALVTIYNPSGEMIYKWHSGDKNVLDVEISYDATKFAVSALNTDENQVAGSIIFFDFDKNTPLSEDVSEDNLFMRLQYNRDNSLTALGDKRLVCFSPNGSVLWKVDFEGRSLISADITSYDNLILALSKEEGSGLSAKDSVIEVYNRKGAQKRVIETNGQIEKMSVAGTRIAAVIDRKIALYDANNGHGSEVTPERDIKNFVLYQNGDHVLGLSVGAYEVLKIN